VPDSAFAKCRRVSVIDNRSGCVLQDNLSLQSPDTECPWRSTAGPKILAVIDWADLKSAARSTFGIGALWVDTKISAIPCIENERPESGDFSRHIYRNCTAHRCMENNGWSFTRDSLKYFLSDEPIVASVIIRIKIVFI
jgi:hypothetical protein